MTVISFIFLSTFCIKSFPWSEFKSHSISVRGGMTEQSLKSSRMYKGSWAEKVEPGGLLYCHE